MWSTLRSLALGAALIVADGWPGAAPLAAADCQFVMGFKALHDMLPNVVGDCLENEHYNLENGDALQHTSNGLLVWRQADNWTAFTDGTTTWIVGPLGLQSRPNSERFPWETVIMTAPSPPPPPSAPNVPPAANDLVQQAIADAAGRAGVDPSAVQVVSVDRRDWPDSSLGCPKPGMAYSQIVTAGYLIVLQAAGKRFEYHTDSSRRLELC